MCTIAQGWLRELWHTLQMPKPPAGPHIAVHLDLTIEEFAALVSIIRGEDLALLPALTAKLKAATDPLRAAEDAQPPQP